MTKPKISLERQIGWLILEQSIRLPGARCKNGDEFSFSRSDPLGG